MELKQTLNQVNAANGDLAKAADILAKGVPFGIEWFKNVAEHCIRAKESVKLEKTIQAAANCVNVSHEEYAELLTHCREVYCG